MFRILHTADLHFSNNTDKLQEVIRTSDYLLQVASHARPDCIVIGGDTVDEYDSRIRMDSECARAAISFVERAADIAPVVIIRGTKSHDRESPYLFRHLRSRFQVHVASDVEMVALLDTGNFAPIDLVSNGNCQCVFTLVPSLDKAALLGRLPFDSVKAGNVQFRELVHDMFAGFGLINEGLSCPTVLVTHGMLTGACFSSGQCAVGEDLEFGLNDLQAARCDAVMLGHVHKHQSWGNVAYSGSPGRMNFGEQEEKGCLLWTFDNGSTSFQFVPTPARRFWFGELAWEDGFAADTVIEHVRSKLDEVSGSDVRFRYSVPEEYRQQVDRAEIERLFVDAGAARVKIEAQVLPRQRVRAAGISSVDSLPEKVQRWAETIGEEVPANVLALASVIEGQDVEELLAMAEAAVADSIGLSGQDRESYCDTQDRESYVPDEQCDLFAEAA